MTQQEAILPLLESVIQDNPSYKFPVESIIKELTSMYIQQEEFQYFSVQSFKKIKSEYGDVFAHIFLQTMEFKLQLKGRDIYSLSTEEYHNEMDKFLYTLENLYVTRVDKKSSDGEMLTAIP